MPAAQHMMDMMERQSFIRKMFEEGARLKAEYGAQNVFDFSLGNPDVPPPAVFKQTIRDLIDEVSTSHGYMPNPGWPHARAAVAEHLKTEQGVSLGPDQVIMTCGAAGALNVAFKALLNPGEEVITPAPYFVEYGTYADNFGGKLVTAPTAQGFRLDPAAIEAAISPRTRAVLINSPNNPTGAVYSFEELAGLAQVLEAAKSKFGQRVYLISDEPYRKIVYDGLTVPSVLEAYPHSLVAHSYSKDLSLAGERIGFLAINPQAEDAAEVTSAAVLANRILGFVNAPSLMQLAVARLQGVSVDVSIYHKRRDLLCDGLAGLGYEFTKPQGAFYLFPKSPLADDVAFAGLLKEERVLVVPGSGFGGPGHFRISYAVQDKVIEGAMDGFKRAIERA
ncbi:MAG: pyridoxal phosphate-dependent aminotransferase [Deltaproteobacteria bacterium]|nr:pyridoxal phosphate-dependent aminotransferase [Deltaproteobacteria bacterium]